MKYRFKGPQQYAHQRATFDSLIAHPRFGVFSQPGTGKTRSLVCAAEARKMAGVTERALYVCPNAVRNTIGREIEMWTDCTYTVLDGGSVARVKQLEETDTFFYIINYESLRFIEAQIVKKGFDLIILDESTRIRNTESATHKAVNRIAKGCKARWIATGTPMPRDPWDFFGQFKILYPGIFGSKTFFRQHYIKYGEVPGSPIPKIIGYMNKDEMKERIAAHSIRFLKKDCLDLPDKVFVHCDVPMGPGQQRVYDEFTALMMAEMPSGTVIPIKSAFSKFMRFHQTTSGFVGSGEECEWLDDNTKLDYLRTLLDTLQLHENKVIIWCTWTPSVEMLRDELAVHSPAMFYGGVKDQDAEIQRFNQDPDCRILIGNSRVGIGCTLNVAHYVVYYELPYFNPEHFDQSQDRNHRIGQTEKVTYYLLMAPRTVDYTIWKNLLGKYELAAELTGDDVKNILTGEVA